jgi:hypothetical protein
MKLNTGALFWAVAIVSAASYIVCAAFVAVAPGATSQFFSWVMHIDLTGLSRNITWASFFGGIICFSLGLGVLAWASAWAYNRLAARTGPTAS